MGCRPGVVDTEELVCPVVFLASSMSSYVTGTKLVVDGGCSLSNVVVSLGGTSVPAVYAGSQGAGLDLLIAVTCPQFPHNGAYKIHRFT